MEESSPKIGVTQGYHKKANRAKTELLENDIHFIARNMEKFSLSDNLYALYWLRSHPEQPEDECLYDPEVPLTPLSGPFQELPNSDAWEKILLETPIFTQDENEQIAYRFLLEELERFITYNALRDSAHPSDEQVLNVSKRIAGQLQSETLESLIEKTSIDFTETIRQVIVESYATERAFLEQLLEERKPFLRPLVARARIKKVSKFGEELPSPLFDKIQEILQGIDLKRFGGNMNHRIPKGLCL